MFLYQLSLTEKMAFVQLAKEMVTVDDGKIDEDEYGLINIMANEMQVAVDNVLSIEFNLNQLAGTFKTAVSQRICLAELLSLAFVNSEFHEKQKMLIDALSNHFAFDSEEVDALKEWVQDAMRVAQKGSELVLQAGEV